MDNQGYPEQRYVVTALLRYIIAAVLFVAIVAFLTWFIFFRDSKSDDTDTSDSISTSQNASNEAAADKDDSNTSDQTDSDDNSVNLSTGTHVDSNDNNSDKATSSDQSKSQTGELANTGPGDVVGLFVIATLAGIAFKHFQLSRR